ncbi:MAG: helix-turn-helix domain-containing protein [Bacillota bacterium]|nr:helix-turn-helix domain-containing protein [Bacillota bacterium]
MESKLYKRRKLLGLTQLDLALLSGVSDRTIRNLEYKNTQANQETIEALTLGYKLSPKDLYRIHNYYDLEFGLAKLDQMIISKYNDITSSDTKDFVDELEKKVQNLNENTFEYYYSNQHLYFFKGVIEYYSQNYQQAYSYYIKALRFTLKDFSMKNIFYYLDYAEVLSRLEIRIIYDLASICHNLGDSELSLKIINILVEKVDTNWNFYCEILSHKAISEYRNENYKEALSYINKALKSAQKLSHYKNLPLYYYNRAAIKIRLDDKSYIEDKNTALDLCDYMGLDNLKKYILKKVFKWE